MDVDLRAASIRERHALLTRVVGPRPIALVSSLGADGRGNLAPFSYFMLGGANPPSLAFCPVNDRHGTAKHTLSNVQETGEFVVSVVTPAMAGRMNQASFAYPRGRDEFDAAGFARAASAVVRPSGVAESPVRLECRVFALVPHGDGPSAGTYVIGEVVYLRADDAVLTDGLPDNRKLALIARLGADYYTRVGDDTLFELPRPEVSG